VISLLPEAMFTSLPIYVGRAAPVELTLITMARNGVIYTISSSGQRNSRGPMEILA
jgi:hypothetical protein